MITFQGSNISFPAGHLLKRALRDLDSVGFVEKVYKFTLKKTFVYERKGE